VISRADVLDNRDCWYKQNIRSLRAPTARIDTTYYYAGSWSPSTSCTARPRSASVYTEFMASAVLVGALRAHQLRAGHHLD